MRVVSPHTVRTHIKNGMRKLEARTRAHAVAIALSEGAIEFDPRYAEAYANLGYALLARNQLDQAERAFFESLLIDPKLERARQGLDRVRRDKPPPRPATSGG